MSETALFNVMYSYRSMRRLKPDPIPLSLIYETFLRVLDGSIYPAVQKVLLACRALGLGASLTTITTLFEAEMHNILGLPDFLTTYALIPIGYPQGRFGPVRHRPVEEVTWLNRYGTAFPKPESADDAQDLASLPADGA